MINHSIFLNQSLAPLPHIQTQPSLVISFVEQQKINACSIINRLTYYIICSKHIEFFNLIPYKAICNSVQSQETAAPLVSCVLNYIFSVIYTQWLHGQIFKFKSSGTNCRLSFISLQACYICYSLQVWCDVCDVVCEVCVVCVM